MKRLILMRHAKTEPWTEGVEDYGRALTPGGHGAARAVAAALASAGWIPERALVSTARRTRETWAHLMPVFAGCEATFEDALYLAGERGISDYIGEADGASTLLVLGHNPGLHDLCVRLIRKAGSGDHQAAMRLSSKLPTGAAALFEADEGGAFVPVHFRLQNFIRPKDVIGV